MEKTSKKYKEMILCRWVSKRIEMRRKLLSINLLFIAGIFAASCFASREGANCLPILTFILLAGFFVFSELSEYRWIHVAAFAVGFCIFVLFFHNFENGSINCYVGEECEIRAEITSVIKKGEKSRYVLAVRDINGDSEYSLFLKNKIIANDIYGKIDIENPLGAEILLRGTLEIPKAAVNPRGFNYREYLYSEGISHICDNFEIEEVSESACVLDRMNNLLFALKKDFLVHMSEDGASLADGILFGNSSEIDDKTLETFRKNGTAHVLAVSGLHVGILYAVYNALQKKYRKKIIPVLFICFLYTYGVVTVWSVSVCRAEFLIILKMLADKLERPFDLATGLGFVAAAICFLNPFSIYSLSFQMSFLAVAILAVLPRAIERVKGRHCNGGVIIQIVLIPYMAYMFNYISLTGIIANIPVIFLISIYVPIGIFSFLAFSVFGKIPCVLTDIIEGLGNIIARINEIFYMDGTAARDVLSWPVCLIAFFYLALFFITSEQVNIDFLRKNFRDVLLRGSIVLLSCGMLLLTSRSAFDRADLVFLDVGYGDALHVKYENFDVLIDGGGRENYNMAKKVLKPYFLKNGVKKVNLTLATSLDEEHYLGVFQLRNCFRVEESKIWCKAGEEITGMKEGFIEVLWPVEPVVNDFDPGKMGNVFKIHFDGVTCLVTGDLTAEGEKALVEYYKGSDALKSDILKVSNHGRAGASCDEFLEAVNPKIAVISAGERSSQKPADEVIEKILKKDIMLYMIDREGAVGIDIDGESFTVCTMQKSMPSKGLTKN